MQNVYFIFPLLVCVCVFEYILSRYFLPLVFFLFILLATETDLFCVNAYAFEIVSVRPHPSKYVR